MAVVNLKSVPLTNRDATPKVLTDGSLLGGRISEAQSCVKAAASDSAGSTYKLIQVPSNARLSGLLWQSESLGSGAVLDVGVWYPPVIPAGGGNFLTAASAGTLISSSIFATALTANGAISLTEIINQAGNMLIPLQDTPLWNVLGLASDPEVALDIGFTVRAGLASAGYVGMKCRYSY